MARKRRSIKTCREIPWNKIKHEYTTGNGSLRALALKHSVDRSNLQRRAKKENWDRERALFQDELLARSYERCIDAAAAAFHECLVEAIEDTRMVRHRTAQIVLGEFNAPDEMIPEEERVTLSRKNDDGTTVRKDIRKKRIRPDPRVLIELLRANTELVNLVLTLRREPEEVRTVEVE